MRWLAGLVLVVGCGEPALCTSDFRLAIGVARSPLTVDFDPVADGVQTPVTVATSMRIGERVTLEVLDDGAAVVATTTAEVDAAGVASFGMVTMPTPRAQLRASAHDICGEATVTTALDVLAGARCELALATTPLAIPFYAPLGVLNRETDADAAVDGEQAVLSVSARTGWNVELRERSPRIGDEVVSLTVQPAPTTTVIAPFRDGSTSIFATCSMPPAVLTSAALFVFVDAVAPTCVIDPPVLAGGTLEVSGHVADPDVEGEAATLTVTPVGGAPLDAGATAIASGKTHGAVPAPAGAVDVTFATQDHARNGCSVTQRF